MLKSIRSGLIALAVRETFAPILHALGWGHIVTALVGSASAGFWAWVSDKQPIDIIVYLLASFAAIVFLLAFFSNLVAGIRGQPMTLAIRNRLTLGEIATRWANEMQGHPGALTRDEILEELLKAVWEGAFEDNAGNSQLILTAPAVAHLKQDDYGKWSRRMLLAALCPRIQSALADVSLPTRMELTPAPDSTPKEWSELRDSVPWSAIGALKLTDYDDNDRSGYIEPLSVSKSRFKRWARQSNPDYSRCGVKGLVSVD